MHARPLRRLDHLRCVQLAKARDVFGNAALEQFDVLRQVAQLRTQLVTVVAADRDAV